MFINLIKAHSRAFFATSVMQSDDTLKKINTLTAGCFTPLNFWGKPLWGDATVFIKRKDDTLIPLTSTTEIPRRFRAYVGATILLIPWLVTGTALKITALCFSRTLYKQHQEMVTCFLRRPKPNLLPVLESHPFSEIQDPLIEHLARHLSLQDIKNFAQADKKCYQIARAVFDKILKPVQNCDPLFLESMGLNRLLQIPKEDLNQPQLYQRLKKDKIICSSDFRNFAILTQWVQYATEGILFIRCSYTLLSRKTEVCWAPNNEKNTTPYLFNVGENVKKQISDLMQGKSVTFMYGTKNNPCQFMLVNGS